MKTIAAAIVLSVALGTLYGPAQATGPAEPHHPWFRHRIAVLKAQRDAARDQHRADVAHLVNVRDLAFTWYTLDTMTAGGGLTYRAAAATVLDRLGAAS